MNLVMVLRRNTAVKIGWIVNAKIRKSAIYAKLKQKTIPQSAAQTAPFTQGSPETLSAVL